MLDTAVIGLHGAPSISSAGFIDILRKVDRAGRYDALGDVFAPRLVGLTLDPIPCQDGVAIRPSAAAMAIPAPALVVIPGLDDDLDTSLEANLGWIEWIRRWHDLGAVIAVSCTGAFLAAEAGVLDGRPATTHWVAADEFRRRYPRVQLNPGRMVVDAGNVITSGGVTTFLNLVIYLTERFGTRERAMLASRLLLVDGDRSSQLPYIAFGGTHDHDDGLVRSVQARIERDLSEPVSIAALAIGAGVNERTLARRFVAATGASPSNYVREARVNAARRLLETTVLSIGEISAAVGYRDVTAFRRLFRQQVGLSPAEYRRKAPGSMPASSASGSRSATPAAAPPRGTRNGRAGPPRRAGTRGGGLPR